MSALGSRLLAARGGLLLWFRKPPLMLAGAKLTRPSADRVTPVPRRRPCGLLLLPLLPACSGHPTPSPASHCGAASPPDSRRSFVGWSERSELQHSVPMPGGAIRRDRCPAHRCWSFHSKLPKRAAPPSRRRPRVSGMRVTEVKADPTAARQVGRRRRTRRDPHTRRPRLHAPKLKRGRADCRQPQRQQRAASSQLSRQARPACPLARGTCHPSSGRCGPAAGSP